VSWVWSWSVNSEEALAHWGLLRHGGEGVRNFNDILSWSVFFIRGFRASRWHTKYVAGAKNNNERILCFCRLCKCSPVNYMLLKQRRRKRRIRLRAGRRSFPLWGHCTSWLPPLRLSVVAILNIKMLRWWRHVIQSWYSLKAVLWNRFS